MADRRKPRAARDARQAFVEVVKAIDPLFKRGDLKAFWPELRGLVAMAPSRRDLALKKSHYLASLAARSLLRDDPKAALAFLDFADESLDSNQLTPFLLEERQELRRQGEDVLRARSSASAPGGKGRSV